MQRLPHEHDLSPVMRDVCSGAKLSEKDREGIRNLHYTIGELTPDHSVYALQMGWKGALNHLLAIFAELAGPEKAAEAAELLARRQGHAQWRNFLRSRGLEHGNPALMAEYQDLGHGIRGPAHATALWAEYDDTKCVVRRPGCLYWLEHPEGTGNYLKEFCWSNPPKGFIRGYLEADSALEKIDVPLGACRGDSGCEHVWYFKKR